MWVPKCACVNTREKTSRLRCAITRDGRTPDRRPRSTRRSYNPRSRQPQLMNFPNPSAQSALTLLCDILIPIVRSFRVYALFISGLFSIVDVDERYQVNYYGLRIRRFLSILLYEELCNILLINNFLYLSCQFKILKLCILFYMSFLFWCDLIDKFQ